MPPREDHLDGNDRTSQDDVNYRTVHFDATRPLLSREDEDDRNSINMGRLDRHSDDDVSISRIEDVPVIHHSGAVWESRETYGPQGFAGLFSSPYVVVCAAFSALGGLLFGYDQGVVSVILVMDQFLDQFPRIADGHPRSDFWKGLLTAMIELGAFLGALNQGWISDKISRKYSISLATAVFLVGSALQTGSVDYGMLTAARFIGGIGVGMLSMVAPLYIAEISPPEIRGALLVLEEFSIVTGIVIAFWITYGTQYILSDWSWRLPFLLQMIPAIILGLGVYFLPFSPRWLVSKGRDREALASLCKLRNVDDKDARVRAEWWDIKAEVKTQRIFLQEKHPACFYETGEVKSKARLEVMQWVDLFRGGCWRRTNAAAGLLIAQQLVGINALIYYSPTLFKTMGLDHSLQLIMSGVLNITQLIGVSSSLWTMDKVGRRPLLLVGAALMCVCHLVIAVLVGLYSDDWPSHRAQGWASVALLLFYMLSFGASWGPIPWAYPSEVFPSSLRAKGVAFATCMNWLFNFIIGLITPPLVENTGYGAYTFFAVWCLLALLWTYFSVKETKGRTLEQMDHVFNDKSSAKDKEIRQRVELEVE